MTARPIPLARTVSLTMAATFAGSGAAALAALAVAHAAGAAGAGTFAQVRIIPAAAAAMLGAGITIANPYLVASGRHPARAIVETTLALGLLMGGLAAAGWVLAADVVRARLLGALSPGAVALVGLAIPLHLLRNYLNSIQQGLLTFRAANLVVCTDDLVSLVAILPVVWMPERTEALVVAAALVGPAASVALALALLARRGLPPRPRVHAAVAREAFRLGLKGHVGRMANMLTWRLDVLILSALASVEVVGCYAVASKAAELLRPLSASLSFVLRPVIAGLTPAEARARGVVLYRRTFVLNLAAVAVLAATGGPLIRLVFGPEFDAAVPAFQILLVGIAAHGADGVLSGYNVGIGRPELNTYTALAGLAVTIAGDLALIPPFGLVGAALASSAAYTAKAVTFTAIFLVTSKTTLAQLVGVGEYTADAA